MDGSLWPYEDCAQWPLRFTFGWVRSCSQNGIWYGLLLRESSGAPGRTRLITKGDFVRSTLPNLNYILGKLIPESRFLGATLMDAGAETSASFLQAFVLALLSYPECQKSIQTEIDTVIGSDRMPNFADYEQLPYLQAFINEVSIFIIQIWSFYHLETIIQIDSSFQTFNASWCATYGYWKYNCALDGLFFIDGSDLIIYHSTRATSSQKALCSLWIRVCKQSFQSPFLTAI